MSDMTDEEIAAEIERLKRELATRQTKAAIDRDLSARVDEIIAANPDVMSGEWDSERLHVCEDCVQVKRVTEPDEPEPDEPEAEEPEVLAAVPWEPDLTLHAGEVIEYQDAVYTVRQSHVTSEDRAPGTAPALYAEGE